MFHLQSEALKHRPWVQARYQKERAANRRNEILLDQLCTEIEVKAVAVRDQQVGLPLASVLNGYTAGVQVVGGATHFIMNVTAAATEDSSWPG